jgi:hypothetical protein
MSVDYKNYPVNWEEIRGRVLKRAKNRCEVCGVLNHAEIYRDCYGRYFYKHEIKKNFVNPKIPPLLKKIRIVLTIVYFEHGYYKDDSDVKAVCQQCYLRFNKIFHKKKRRKKNE